MLTGIRDAAIIFNPVAGGRSRKREHDVVAAQEILREAGLRAELRPTGGPGAATELAREAVAAGRALVIACGGDGTINEVVNGLAGSRVPLAVLPAGTANVLGKELQLPWDVRAAARLIPRATLRRIALGLAVPAAGPPRYFICLAGAGPDAEMVRAVPLKSKLRMGMLAYWFEGFRQLVKYRIPTFRVSSDGREHTVSLIVVGRTKHYGGPVKITTEADLFEDCFEVMASTATARYRYLTDLTLLLLGQLRRIPDTHFWKTTAVRCEPLGVGPVYAQVDGELIGELPVEFRIVPDALTLAVPAQQ